MFDEAVQLFPLKAQLCCLNYNFRCQISAVIKKIVFFESCVTGSFDCKLAVCPLLVQLNSLVDDIFVAPLVAKMLKSQFFL